MSRNRHPTKEYEALFKDLESQEWRVDGGGNRHFKVRCPNDCKCYAVFSSTPGTQKDLLRRTTHLRNATCWKDR